MHVPKAKAASLLSVMPLRKACFVGIDPEETRPFVDYLRGDPVTAGSFQCCGVFFGKHLVSLSCVQGNALHVFCSQEQTKQTHLPSSRSFHVRAEGSDG